MKKIIIKNSGQAMLLATMLFLAASLTIVLGSTNPVLDQLKISKDLLDSRQSFTTADASFEDVLYRLKHNMTVGSSETLSIGNSSAVTNISDVSGGKTLTTQGVFNNKFRKNETKLIEGNGVSFSYGIQAGDGGFIIDGGSSVTGNIYSNGSVLGGSGIQITGSVIAANSSPITANQVNDSPSTPPNGFIFGNTNGTQDSAQSFIVDSTSAITKARIFIKKIGDPANINVKITTDNGGKPNSSSSLTSATLAASLITTNYGWVDVVFPTNPQLTAGTVYWLVLDAESNSSRYYNWAANTSYPNGVSKVGKLGSTWNFNSPANLTAYFSIFVGGALSEIRGTGGDHFYLGSTASDIVWADSVTNVEATGPIYCQTTGGSNNKSCDTSRGQPSPQPMPVSDANIDEWKAEALAGGTIDGNYTVDSSGATIGPKVINGNLTVSGGGILTITGTLWIKGNILISGGGGVGLASNFNSRSGILLADGYVSLTGNTQFSGSGTAGSYPVVVSTSNCPNGGACVKGGAIYLSGGSGAVVLVAPYGTVSIQGGSALRAVTGKTIIIDGGGNVTYDSGLANMNFSSGPSGTWVIDSWRETQ